jgi:uncharacterized protein YkwD
MQLFFRAVLALATLIVVSATAASACSVAIPRQAMTTSFDPGRINFALLDAAVRAETNAARCRNGLGPLRAANSSLVTIASRHSVWMIRSGNLSHRSNVAGRSSPLERIQAAGLRPRAGSENIGFVSLYDIDGKRFRIQNAQSCAFSSNSGEPIPRHTYASIARHIVTLWMNSPSHRRNILMNNIDRTSTGVAFDQNGPYCGRVWFTQKLVG